MVVRFWRTKYVVEWVLALILTVVLFPLLLILAMLVKGTSRGPVFHLSDRLGRKGKTFSLVKFRSMREHSGMVLAPDGKLVTLKNDARLTSVGRFLRLGFDELPQLFNVLKGEMCLIGPRPDVPWELDRYTARERLRMAALPGITGLAQVLDGRSLSNTCNYEIDVQYVTRSSAWIDLLIALATLPYALGWTGAGVLLLGNLRGWCHEKTDNPQ